MTRRRASGGISGPDWSVISYGPTSTGALTVYSNPSSLYPNNMYTVSVDNGITWSSPVEMLNSTGSPTQYNFYDQAFMSGSSTDHITTSSGGLLLQQVSPLGFYIYNSSTTFTRMIRTSIDSVFNLAGSNGSSGNLLYGIWSLGSASLTQYNLPITTQLIPRSASLVTYNQGYGIVISYATNTDVGGVFTAFNTSISATSHSYSGATLSYLTSTGMTADNIIIGAYQVGSTNSISLFTASAGTYYTYADMDALYQGVVKPSPTTIPVSPSGGWSFQARDIIRMTEPNSTVTAFLIRNGELIWTRNNLATWGKITCPGLKAGQRVIDITTSPTTQSFVVCGTNGYTAIIPYTSLV